MEQLGIIDGANRLERLSRLGDSLERLNKDIPWAMLRPKLVAAFDHPENNATGWPPFDRILILLEVLWKSQWFAENLWM